MSDEKTKVILLGGAAELAAIEARMRKVRNSGEAWPMLVYEEILAISDRWDVVGRDAGYKSINHWLYRCFSTSWNLGRFKKVRDVVGRIGEHAKRTWTWSAAQWAYNNLSDDELRVVVDSYRMWTAKNHDHSLTVTKLQKRVKDMRSEKKGDK